MATPWIDPHGNPLQRPALQPPGKTRMTTPGETRMATPCRDPHCNPLQRPALQPLAETRIATLWRNPHGNPLDRPAWQSPERPAWQPPERPAWQPPGETRHGDPGKKRMAILEDPRGDLERPTWRQGRPAGQSRETCITTHLRPLFVAKGGLHGNPGRPAG